jgi:hypothetical protein
MAAGAGEHDCRGWRAMSDSQTALDQIHAAIVQVTTIDTRNDRQVALWRVVEDATRRA